MDVSRKTLRMIFGDDMVENHFEDLISSIMKDPDGYRQKVLGVYSLKKNEIPEVCAKCGGKCCKQAPCHYATNDFDDLTYHGLKKIIKKLGYISILKMSGEVAEVCLDLFEYNRPDFYVLRVRTKGMGIATEAKKISEKDKCMMLTDHGCKLSYEERPYGAKMLIPREKQRCMQLYGMDECTADWRPYQDVLRRLYRYFDRQQKIFNFLKSVHPEKT